MHFRIFLQQLRRGTRRTLLYTLILMAVSAFWVMSANLYQNSIKNLQAAGDTYSTIALMELYGDIDEQGNLVEPFTEEHVGYESVAVKGYDFSDVVKADGVVDWDLRERYAAYIDGEFAVGHEGFLMSNYDILRFRIKGDEPVKIPIERGALSLDSEDAECELEIIDQVMDRYIYHETFRFQAVNHSERLSYLNQETSKAEAKAFNGSEEENYLILYPNVEYIGSFFLASNWKPSDEHEGMYVPAGKKTHVQLECLPYLQHDYFVNYKTSKEFIDANKENQDIRYMIQRWDDVQNDPELKAYFESAAKALKIQYSVFNVELTNDIEGVPAFHIGGAYLKDGRYITSEEYENGAKVCIISSALAIKQGWELGDKLSLDFFEFSAFPSVNYDYSVNQAIWNEEVEGFFDTGEFEIVGIIGQTQFTGNSGISKSTMEQPWNNIYIPKNAVNNRTPQEELPVHGALLTLWLENGSVDRFMADMEALGLTETKEGQYNPSFIFYDQGYSQIQPGLEAMHSTAQLLLVLSAVLIVVTSILLAYFYAQNQKQSVGIFRMLGGSKLKSLTAVLLCIILIALLGAGIGAGAGHILTQTVSAKIIESNLSQSEAAAAFQAFVLQSGSEAQELATEAHLNLSLSAGGITILLPVVLVLIFVILYINKEPRELLPKSGH